MSRYPKETHFIDTCILLEILLPEREEDQRNCDRYIKRVGNIFEGCMSIPALGEFAKVALEDAKESDSLFQFLGNFIKFREVKIIGISETSLSVMEEIRIADSRIDLLDSMHIACAKEAGSAKFITLDHKLIHNPVLEKIACMKICHPKEFF